ncbi:hypothetical protein NBRC116596_07460 [Litorivita sp. NS0012-18]
MFAGNLTVDESRATHEDSQNAYEMVRDLLQTSEDVVGILIVGGGISGVLRALRETPLERRHNIKLVCRDLGPEARKGLTEGLITAALCHPLGPISSALVQNMVEAISTKEPRQTSQCTIPFGIVTPENI